MELESLFHRSDGALLKVVWKWCFFCCGVVWDWWNFVVSLVDFCVESYLIVKLQKET